MFDQIKEMQGDRVKDVAHKASVTTSMKSFMHGHTESHSREQLVKQPSWSRQNTVTYPPCQESCLSKIKEYV